MTEPMDHLKKLADISDEDLMAREAIFLQNMLNAICSFCETGGDASIGRIIQTSQSLYFTTLINMIRNCQPDMTKEDATAIMARMVTDQVEFGAKLIANFEKLNG